MNKYEKVMSKIEVTPEMKERILSKIETKQQKKAIPQWIWTPQLLGGLVAVCVCVMIFSPSSVFKPKMDLVGVKGNIEVSNAPAIVTYETFAKLQEATQLPMQDLPVIVENSSTSYTAYGYVAEIEQKNELEQSVVFRCSEGLEDNSGIYPETEIVNEDHKTITGTVHLTLVEEKVIIAWWTEQNYSYSLYFDPTWEKKDVISLIKQIRK